MGQVRHSEAAGVPVAGSDDVRRATRPLATVILILAVLGAAGGASRAGVIDPLPALQDRIDAVVGIIVASDAAAENGAVAIAVDDLQAAAVTGEEHGAVAAVTGERHRAAAGRVRLLEQLLLYLAGADGTERSMGGALLLHRLAFTVEEKIAAVVPHLDTTDAQQRRVLHHLLSTIDRVDGAAADFTPYVRLLSTPGTEADRLTLYMYEIDPAMAVRTLQVVHGTAPVRTVPALQETIASVAWLVAERDRGRDWTVAERDTCRGQMDELGQSPDWWIRLYAAAMAARQSDAAAASLLGRLRDDRDQRVRSFASRPGAGRAR